MEKINEKELIDILDERILRIAPYKNQWLIETEGNKKWLAKKTNHQKSLLWLVKMGNELHRRGFSNMPVLKTDGRIWIISSFISGKTGDYSNFDEVKRMMSTLGQFHLAGERLFAPSNRKSVFLLYHRLYRRLVNYYHVLNNVHNIPGDLGILMRAHGKDFYFDGLQAWEKLQNSSLRKYTNKNWRVGNLAHRDLASHNWMVDNNSAYLIDWDTADYDTQLGDISQMSTRVLTENNWTDDWIKHVFNHYEHIRPLDSVEKNLLSTLASFPNEFYREVIGLAQKKKGFKEKNVLRYLRKIIASQNQWRSQVKQLGDW